jgi:hypothetical protein
MNKYKFCIFFFIMVINLSSSQTPATEKGEIVDLSQADKVSDNFYILETEDPLLPHTIFTLYNANGKRIDTFQYRFIIDFGDVVLTKTVDGLYAIYSKDGEQLHPPQFTGITNFGCGVFGVHNGTYYGYMNTKGELVIPFKFKEATMCNGQTIAAKDTLGHWNLYFPNGELATSINFTQIYNQDVGDIIAYKVVTNDNIGFMSKTGESIIPPQYSNFIKPLNDEHWRVLKDDKWGIIDGKGNLVVDYKYDDISFKKFRVYEGHFDGKVELIDLN